MRLTTRVKRSKQMIRLVRPFELTASDLVYPIFVREDGKEFEIPSMSGQRYLSLDGACRVCEEVADLGIPAVIIFGILKEKNADGSVALEKDNFHLKVFERLREELGNKLVLISNVCLCDYTIDECCVYSEGGKVLNEKTAVMLGKISVAHAEAGADVVAPAAMADGQVKHIREALDEVGFDDVSIMSYIKSDSVLFQPFFEAVSTSSKPRVGVDSSKFRTDAINRKMFVQKLRLDIQEGADMVIIKPALTNLDIIRLTNEMFPEIPVAAFQVSGEYAMIKALSKYYHVDENRFLFETLSSIKRPGADIILTYYALDIAKAMKQMR